MVHKEYSTGEYKYSNISSGAAMKDPEIKDPFLITLKPKRFVIMQSQNYIS